LRRCGDTGGTARCTAGRGAGARGGGGTEGGLGVSSRERAAAGGEAVAAGAGGACNPDTVRVRGGGAMRRGAAGGRCPGTERLAEEPSGLDGSASEAPASAAPFDASVASSSGSGGNGVVGEEGVLASVLIKLGENRGSRSRRRRGAYRQQPLGGQRIFVLQRSRASRQKWTMNSSGEKKTLSRALGPDA
jgi:hypothetical protein